MRIELKEFQLEAVDALVDEFDSARYEAAKGKLQAISLASPTGSGKTAIATALIERLLAGDDEHGADPEATFLWISDQPELNEQTRSKMLATSSLLELPQLEVIDASLNQEVLSPGRVYFLNTQKLGKNSRLVRPGDKRDFTLWQTIQNTIEFRPTNFYVILDEAHRGMQQRQEREEANTIIQKFIKGSDGEISPIPILLAISATIDRFNEVVAKTSRVKRRWEVSIDAVRESGLLKEAINLFHPDEAQPGDITMLRQAAKAWKAYRDRWKAYAEAEGETPIKPVLVVQVRDGSAKQVSKTNLGKTLNALADELDSPPSEAFAHAFQGGSPITVGPRNVRYLAPSAIDSDPDVQVVFFKSSLNTGWDCPRAEVMMSFRPAKDHTLIAQLVGRMVRAPLARSVPSNEYLNTVALYLPHYDKKGLGKVIDRLQADDPTNMPPIEVREGKETVNLTRSRGSKKIFDLLSELPSYTIPRATTVSQVRRLGKLATLLSRYGIDDEAPDSEREFLVALLQDDYELRKKSKAFEGVVKESGILEVRNVEWHFDPEILPTKTVEVEISDENVNDLFDWAGRRFGEGLHKAYWKTRAATGAKNHRTTKLEAYALAADGTVIESLQEGARDRVQWLLKHYGAQIKQLSDDAHHAFYEIQRLGVEPELTPPVYPKRIDVRKDDESYTSHLYVDDSGDFPFRATTWEEATLAEELARPDLIGWMRNPDRKIWSLCVPYAVGKQTKGCYPDFLVVRKENDKLVVDIVDPHLLSHEDAWCRAKGLASYADIHANQFGRIEMVRIEKDQVQRLDLTDEKTRERVLSVSSNPHLRELFDTR